MKEEAYLIAGGPPLDRTAMIRALAAALQASGAEKPTVAYIGTASSDNRPFFVMLKSLLKEAGAGEVKLLKLANNRADVEGAKQYLTECDVVFLSGGEVDDGMFWLRKHGLCDFLRELFQSGKLFAGMSAGSIMMGTKWITAKGTNDISKAELFDCLGLIPDVFDTHAENEDWIELKTTLRLMGPGASGHGLASGTAIRDDGDGNLILTEGHIVAYKNTDGEVSLSE